MKDKLLFIPTSNVWIQLFRYLFVGGGAFIVDYCLLYILFTYIGMHYLLAAAIAFIAGLFVNYVISVRWVFSKERVFNPKKEFIFFGLIGVVGLLLNELIIWAITDGLSYHVMVSKLISTGIVFCWNFVARKYMLFRK